MTRAAKQMIELNVDGELVEVPVRPHHLLVDVIRDGCGRMSVKEGCESASCGACTVLIDGEPALSCITLAVDAVGHEIRTAESLSTSDRKLHPLQQAFIDHHAVQCGFCTPGMLLTGLALLQANPHPDEAEIRSAISGNICRCTGYVRIVRAIADAAQKMNHGAASRAKELAS
ncbi:(2Fe-2S)-binding protein [Rhodoligotrophos defluvii]|uniref:(2Fe-2S)-binding protein n=1 Tax=Rhodoligotrophos defluvii TaxID=2561934 RepID=UPI0010C9C65F|nr:(2Fe-2S)-binding protein [Rhodoligotrophos defluvii]